MTDDSIIWSIASILDHPSVYMGGPSHGNQRRAAQIVKFLRKENLLNEFEGPKDSNEPSSKS
jgi:hypothetical protein